MRLPDEGTVSNSWTDRPTEDYIVTNEGRTRCFRRWNSVITAVIPKGERPPLSVIIVEISLVPVSVAGSAGSWLGPSETSSARPRRTEPLYYRDVGGSYNNASSSHRSARFYLRSLLTKPISRLFDELDLWISGVTQCQKSRNSRKMAASGTAYTLRRSPARSFFEYSTSHHFWALVLWIVKKENN